MIQIHWQSWQNIFKEGPHKNIYYKNFDKHSLKVEEFYFSFTFWFKSFFGRLFQLILNQQKIRHFWHLLNVKENDIFGAFKAKKVPKMAQKKGILSTCLIFISNHWKDIKLYPNFFATSYHEDVSKELKAWWCWPGMVYF